MDEDLSPAKEAALLPIPDEVVKPPNKHQHEQQVELVQSFITKREEEVVELTAEVKRKKEVLGKVRQERELINTDKGRVFSQLERVNKEVAKKSEQVQRLRGSLGYQSCEQIEEQVKRLEWQLNKTHFKLPEERRIVAEIDRLKRSKRALSEYNGDKEVLERLRGEQKLAREEREEWFRAGKEARGREEELKGNIRDLTDKLEMCKGQVEELRVEKRGLVAEFRNKENQFRKLVSARREEQRRKQEEERKKFEQERMKEEQEAVATCEPFFHERTLCSLLLHYCEKLTGGASTPLTPEVPEVPNHFLSPPSGCRRRSSGFSTNGSNCSSRYATPLGPTPATTPLSGTPPNTNSIVADMSGFYIKKKEADADFFAPTLVRKKSKKGRERRMSIKKLLTHTPETYLQFSSLGLAPPHTMAAVGEAQLSLRDKMLEFEEKATEVKLARVTIAQNNKSASAENNFIPAINIVEEDDVGDSVDFPLPPTLTVETSPPNNGLKLPGSYSREGLSLALNTQPIPVVTVRNPDETTDVDVNYSLFDSTNHDDTPETDLKPTVTSILPVCDIQITEPLS